MLYRPIFIRLKRAVYFLEDYLVQKQISSIFSAKGCDPESASRSGSLFSQVARVLVHAGISLRSTIYAFWVPGRIEVLGKHTDYAGGQSLLAASERGIAVLVVPDNKQRLHFLDALNEEGIEISLEGRSNGVTPGWSIYPETATRRIISNFGSVQSGGVIAFGSNLPPAAGMSSSSALIIAITMAVQSLSKFDETDIYKKFIPSKEAYADYLGHIENGKSYKSLLGEKGVGTEGGSQDHLAILCARQKSLLHASFLPTRVNAYYSLPANLTFYIGCSGVKARKAAGARRKYNDAATMARTVLDEWNRFEEKPAVSLGEMIAQPAFDKNLFIDKLSSTHEQLALRIEQFYNEVNIYIPETIVALKNGDYELLGEMVEASQIDAERCLGNQVDETIFLAASAREMGAVAASAFGAGFGGAVWALVEREKGPAFVDRWSRQFFGRFPKRKKARFFEEKTGLAAHQVNAKLD